MIRKCEVCASDDRVQRISICVDGELLRLEPQLCAEHSGRFIVRCGAVLASLKKPAVDVFLDWNKERE